MAYAGWQGIYTESPVFRHPDGTVSRERPERIVAYHDACAIEAFGVDTTQEGWGSWHHDKGMSWYLGKYSMNGHPCELCGKPC